MWPANRLPFPEIDAAEAAELIQNGQTVAMGGFTQAGSPKAVPPALAERARRLRKAGQPFSIRLLAGASTDVAVDDALAAVDAISYRTPYQSCPVLRQQINEQRVEYVDLHLSHLIPLLKGRVWGTIDHTILEAAAVFPDGRILLTNAVGAVPTFVRLARSIIIELNSYHPNTLEGLHDIYELASAPHTREIPIYRCSDRIGATTVQADPAKISAIVRSNIPNSSAPFAPIDGLSQRIGENIAEFLLAEKKAGRIPKNFLPLQAGVGNVSNAVMAALGSDPSLPPFDMYSEILQDTVFDGIETGRIRFASSSGLTVSPPVLRRIYDNLATYRRRLVLRPQEITNHPEIIRRLGLIGINTALEVDLWGNVNSTHLRGTLLVNGIGGSGDFARNCAITIFATPSVAKGGTVSCIVPLCSHIDHTEHDTQIFATEQGIADLRGRGPMERAKLIIEHCAHPDFRPLLREAISRNGGGRINLDLAHAFDFHRPPEGLRP